MQYQELKEKLTAGEITLYDIRESFEYEADPGLPEAERVPLMEFVEKIERNELQHDKEIVTVCRSGARCQQLTHFLREHGYEADYLEGGLVGLER